MSKKSNLFLVMCEGEPVVPFYTQAKAEEYAKLLAIHKSNYFNTIRVYTGKNLSSPVCVIKGDKYVQSSYSEIFAMFKKVKMANKIAKKINQQIEEQPEYLLGEGDIAYIEEE